MTSFDTRERILDAAARIFRRGGYEATVEGGILRSKAAASPEPLEESIRTMRALLERLAERQLA